METLATMSFFISPSTLGIRMLQYVLLKTALLLGVKVHPAVEFLKVVEPSSGRGWRAEVKPNSCPVTNSCYDIMIGADGKKYVLPGFRTKEFRPRLAIAITANFVNQGTQKEAQISEISGIAYVYHQAFFNEMRDKHGIELENVVYYKDETHYFVMTAKKQSLLKRGVLKQVWNMYTYMYICTYVYYMYVCSVFTSN